jgi:hydrophobic W protein
MSHQEKLEPGSDGEYRGKGALSIAQSLVGFLDRNLGQFSRPVRDFIGTIILLLLAVVVLHGFVAPTYVEGRLKIQEAPDQLPMLAKGYMLVRGNESFFTNDNGYWIMPAARGLIPQRAQIQLRDDSGTYLDEFGFWAPWPVLSALRVSSFDVIVCTYERPGSANRIKITYQDLPGRVLLSHVFPGVTHAESSGGVTPYILVHLEGLGDIGCRDSGWCGTRGESRRLEGFSISPPRTLGDVRLKYFCHLQDSGDTAWLPAGQFCGTRGQSRRLEGFSIALEGRDAGKYHVRYQAWLQDTGATPVVSDGAFVGTREQSRRVEAIRVWIE